ncbi:hypothetical protein Vretimale_998 [Volvox reticuliferus]|nr:hypothetical protein Vretifemale_10480 [Volvox reticuliferus]GIL94833.1 hypothetical protein Vretimale_998 [Volvox reticuliferus]
MMKADYERKRANASSSGGGKDGGFGGGGGGSAHKRARHLSEGPATSSQGQQPPPPPPLPVEQHGMTPVSISKHSHQQIQQLRQIAEEREATVRSLEGALRKELEENQRLHQRLEEAQQRAQEAAAREAAASQKALTRDVEIGSLKGEIAMLRTQNAAHLERQSAAHKARIADLEASVQRLKDALLEKERGERELRRAACNKGDTSGAYRADGSGNLDDL